MDNLCAIIDVNRLGQSDPAPLQHDMEAYRVRMESFVFNAIVIDGHDIGEIVKAFNNVRPRHLRITRVAVFSHKICVYCVSRFN